MRIVFSYLCLCVISIHANVYYPQTHNPLTHVILRTTGIFNVIRGSGLLSLIMESDKKINIEQLTCGAALITLSHLLYFLEHIEHPEYHQQTKKNTIVLTVAVPDDLSQSHTQDAQTAVH